MAGTNMTNQYIITEDELIESKLRITKPLLAEKIRSHPYNPQAEREKVLDELCKNCQFEDEKLIDESCFDCVVGVALLILRQEGKVEK